MVESGWERGRERALGERERSGGVRGRADEGESGESERARWSRKAAAEVKVALMAG